MRRRSFETGSLRPSNLRSKLWRSDTLRLFFLCYLALLIFETSDAFCHFLPTHNTQRLKRHGAGTTNSGVSLILKQSSSSNSLLLDDKNDIVVYRRPHLVFPGGGIFFYWQAGVVSYLREQGYDLSSCTFSGASAGALTATLASTGVDFYKATDLALELAGNAGVWDRRGGLQGIWGPMIEEWLDVLLPPTIVDETAEGRLSLLVTPLPMFGKEKISAFSDRKDLIKCNMASVHLPWFLDGKLTSDFREKPHIDGSFLSKASDYLPEENGNRNIITIDWTKDPAMQSKKGLDFIEALSPDGIYGLLEQGKRYARYMEEQGKFKQLKKCRIYS